MQVEFKLNVNLMCNSYFGGRYKPERVLVVHLLVLGQLHELQGSGIKYPSLGVKVEVALGQIMQNSLKIYVTVMFM